MIVKHARGICVAYTRCDGNKLSAILNARVTRGTNDLEQVLFSRSRVLSLYFKSQVAIKFQAALNTSSPFSLLTSVHFHMRCIYCKARLLAVPFRIVERARAPSRLSRKGLLVAKRACGAESYPSEFISLGEEREVWILLRRAGRIQSSLPFPQTHKQRLGTSLPGIVSQP